MCPIGTQLWGHTWKKCFICALIAFKEPAYVGACKPVVATRFISPWRLWHLWAPHSHHGMQHQLQIPKRQRIRSRCSNAALTSFRSMIYSILSQRTQDLGTWMSWSTQIWTMLVWHCILATQKLYPRFPWQKERIVDCAYATLHVEHKGIPTASMTSENQPTSLTETRIASKFGLITNTEYHRIMMTSLFRTYFTRVG